MTLELERLRETLARLVARLERDVATHERDLAFEQSLASALVELGVPRVFSSHRPLVVLEPVPDQSPSGRDELAWLERRAAMLERRREALRAVARVTDRALETLLFRSELPILVRTPGGNVFANTRGASILAAIGPDARSCAEGLFTHDGRGRLASCDLPHERAARGERIDGLELVLRGVGDGDPVALRVGARPLPHGGAVVVFRPCAALGANLRDGAGAH